ncbi:MAG: rhodanese-like domain-containing protein [Phycisphaerales bacterium]
MNLLNPPSVTPAELKAMLERGDDIELIDVREPAEHAIVKFPNAKLIPLKTLPDHLDELDPDKTQVMICKVGQRSAMAVAFLRERDYEAINLTGGILGWVREIDPSLPTY